MEDGATIKAAEISRYIWLVLFTHLVLRNVWCVKNELSKFFYIKLFRLFIAIPQQNKTNIIRDEHTHKHATAHIAGY